MIEGFVTPLSGKAPVVKVPLKGHYAPNVFVSVLAVRGRVADVQPTALVDLGKPAFRMGVAEINVGWRAHELRVKVTPERDVFKVRDKAKVAIEVTRADGGTPAKGAEVALVAVDEGLLELMPNESWKLLETMMQARPIEVTTATAAMQVVGRRHYGRKALVTGGGGGRQTSRELFDTLLAWKARVKLDERGRAEVEIPLNDSLTAFRIVAVASAGNGLFGTGTRVDPRHAGRDAALRRAAAGARTGSLRGHVHRAQCLRSCARLKVEATVMAAPATKGESPALETRSVQLAAGEARDVTWETTAPVNAEALQWTVIRPRRGERCGRQSQGHAEGRRGGAGAHLPGNARCSSTARPRCRSPGRRTRSRAAAGSRCTCAAGSPTNCPACASTWAAIRTPASNSARPWRSRCATRRAGGR